MKKLTYKELCAEFNIPYYSGKQKMLQLEDLLKEKKEN